MGYFNFKNGETALNEDNLIQMQKGLMEMVFPVGSTYTTPTNTNPSEILGFGTWERFKGKTAIGLDEDDEDFNIIGKAGGEKKHRLTVDEIPQLDVNVRAEYGSGEQNNYLKWANTTGTDWGTYTVGKTSGGGQEHNNLQPYQVVGYIWLRIA